MEETAKWVAEQKKEDIFEEIINNSKETNLTHLRRVGWNGFPDRFRAPSWQLLLQYLPTSARKRKSTLRRKRNEYHGYITKYCFEFDFCLTERKLTTPKDVSPISEKTHRRKSLSLRESFAMRAASTAFGSRKNIFESASTTLMPLFSQPSEKEKDGNIAAREDSLLLQIRKDVSFMVDVPTKSDSSSSNPCGKGDLQQKKSSKWTPSDLNNINGCTKTTNNRLFANKDVKASLERIIYLWAVRDEDKNSDPSPYSSRYIPEIVDIIYPIYLTNLQGYIWDSHTSTCIDKMKGDKLKQTANPLKTLRDPTSSSKSTLNFDVIELEDVQLSMSSEPTIFEDEDRKCRIKRCENLAIGVGIENIPEEILEEIEADTYWCLENFMAAVQDYRYNDAFIATKRHGHPEKRQKRTGLQNMIVLMESVVQRVDPLLHGHLRKKGVEYLWFASRWLNSLHVRDLNEKSIIRLWDTCLCEEVDKATNGSYFSTFGFNSKRARKRLLLPGFLNFQVYVCAALLHSFRNNILSKGTFEDVLVELRNPNLEDWGTAEVEILLSQAHVWSASFQGSEDQLVKSAMTGSGDDTYKTWAQRCHWPPRKSTSRPLTKFDLFTRKYK